MKKIIYILPLLAALVSCQKEELLTTPNDAVRISAQIGEGVIHSRVNSTNAEATAWTIGDKVAVNNQGGNYVNYTYDGVAWNAAEGVYLKWSKPTMTFKGYYPVTAGTSFTDFVLPTDQTDVVKISSADYMTVTEEKTKPASGADVSLKFVRRTARVIVKIAKIQNEFVGTPVISNLKITSAYASYSNGATSGGKTAVTAYKAAEDSYMALVIPYNNASGGDFITLDVTDDTGTKSLKLSTIYATEPGKSYTHNLTVGKGKIELGSVAVENWAGTVVIPGDEAHLDTGVFVVKNNVDGSLSTRIDASDRSNVRFLSISGSLNYNDFASIRTNLTNLEILDLSQTTITEIPTHALNYYIDDNQPGNKKLRKIILPPTVRTIGDYAFQYCEALTTISLDGVETIGEGAFQKCSSLVSVDLGDNLERISNVAFYRCTSLQSVEIPASVHTLGRWMFEGCSNLKRIKLNEGVETIPASAFYGCTALESINIPTSVKTLNGWMFQECSKLKTIKLPEGIETIPASAFYGVGLESINIPASVKSIGGHAFASCLALKAITIPQTVRSLGEWMFNDCSSLTEATVLADVTTLPIYMFNNCSGLTTCTLNDKIQEIGERAFSTCAKLSSVNIPSSLATIGNNAFSNTALTSLTLPASVSTIEDGAFYASKITNLTINSTVDLTIGHSAFVACTKFNEVMKIELPATLKSLSCTSFYSNGILQITCHAATPPTVITGDPSITPNPEYWIPYVGCYMKVPAASVNAYKAIYFWNRSFQDTSLNAIQ